MKHLKLNSVLGLVLILVATSRAAHSQPAGVWKPLRFNAVIGEGGTSTCAYDPATHKLYAALIATHRRDKTLMVFDVAADGTVAETPRAYAAIPGKIDETKRDFVKCMLLDTRHKKLFLGVGSEQDGFNTPLAVVSLDDKGEPKGTPEAFASGNPNNVIEALALHPKGSRLYSVGWGGNAAYAMDLDAQGRPQAPAKPLTVGDAGKYSISIRSDGTKLYLGSYPDRLEILDLDAAGDAVGAPQSLTTANGVKEYLRLVANDRGVFFKDKDGYLNHYKLDAAGNPVGEQIRDDISVQTLAASGPANLVIAELSQFKDAIDGTTRSSGVRLREIAVATDGSLGQTLRAGPVAIRQNVAALSAAPAVAWANLPSDKAFVGNRIAGLSVRATLVSAETASPMPPAKSVLPLDNKGISSTPLRFIYSPTFHKAYSVFAGELLCYDAPWRPGQPAAVRLAAPNATEVTAFDRDGRSLLIAQKDGSIRRFALDDKGVPADSGESLASGAAAVALIRVNPATGQIYVFATGAVTPVPNPNARVITIPSAGGVFSDAAVAPAQNRIYVATEYNGSQNIWVWKLRADGGLAAEPPVAYADGLKPGGRSLLIGLKVDSVRRRLYAAGYPEVTANLDHYESALAVYKLDEDGDPIGVPALRRTLDKRGIAASIGLSANGQWLYASGTSDGTVYSYPLLKNGDLPPDASVEKWPVGGDSGHGFFTESEGGKSLLLSTAPATFESIPLTAEGRPQQGLRASFSIGQRFDDMGVLTPGATSQWVTLDESLKDGVGIANGLLELHGAPITRAVVKLETALKKEGKFQPLTSATTTIVGPQQTLFLPRYGLDDPTAVASMIETTDQRFKGYLALAEKYALKPEDRPKQFIVPNGIVMLDSNLSAIQDSTKLLGLLGHNTLQLWPSPSPGVVHDEAVKNGLTRTREAVYTPNTRFDYLPELMTTDAQDKWFKELIPFTKNMGFKPADNAIFHMADEPGWYFPYEFNDVKAKPERLQVFRAYLKEKGMTPELLGRASWDQVVPIGSVGLKTLGDRRLYYWSINFFAESNSRAFAAGTATIRRNVGPDVLTTTNLGNWPGRYYTPSPGKAIAYNPESGLDAAMGGPNWFDLGRKKAVGLLWTEDWFGDGVSQIWSMYADQLRSAAREGDLKYGGYVIGQTAGGYDNGAKFKIMSLAGHGAKAIEPYIFGPVAAMVDGWSDRGDATYGAVASGLRLLGRGERLLYPGRPRNGTVAILFSQASQVWDAQAAPNYYMNEYYGLHAGLVHQQYPVDFVDDVDVEQGALQKYGYSTLYVCGPNLSVKAQRAIMAWVQAGGTLALLPGAATADEYNEPTSLLQTFGGAAWTNFKREPVPIRKDADGENPIAITATDPRIAAGAVTGYATTALSLKEAKPLATFAGGKAALAAAVQGSGRVMTYGFWPGTSYWGTPGPYAIMGGWSAAKRNLVTAPAMLGKAPRPVQVSEDVVEAALLESKQGIAVTLLNWWLALPRKSVTVTVASTPPMLAADKAKTLRVESADSGQKLPYRMTPKGLEVMLPLKDVDVLMISWQ